MHLTGYSDTRPKQAPVQALWRMLRDRFLSLAMLLTIAQILLVSMVLNAFVALLGGVLDSWNPSIASSVTFLDDAMLDLFVMSALFAMLFRYLPDVRLKWRGKSAGFAAFLTADHVHGWSIPDRVHHWPERCSQLLRCRRQRFGADALGLLCLSHLSVRRRLYKSAIKID